MHEKWVKINFYFCGIFTVLGVYLLDFSENPEGVLFLGGGVKFLEVFFFLLKIGRLGHFRGGFTACALLPIVLLTMCYPQGWYGGSGNGKGRAVQEFPKP